jgi:hypothetical protein
MSVKPHCYIKPLEINCSSKNCFPSRNELFWINAIYKNFVGKFNSFAVGEVYKPFIEVYKPFIEESELFKNK